MNICIHGNTLYAWVTASTLAKHHTVLLCTGDSDVVTLSDPELENNIHVQISRKTLIHQYNMADTDISLYPIHIFADNAEIEDVKSLIKRCYTHLNQDLCLIIQTPYVLGSLELIEQYSQNTADLTHSPFYISIVGMPLFIREGTSTKDFSEPWLTLTSGQTKATELVTSLLQPYITNQTKVMRVSHRTAELIRLSINAMLATRISFVNEMSSIAEHLGVDIKQVTEAMGADPRIGADYLQPGCGFGGTKFSDDLARYASISDRQLGHTGLINTVLSINESQREILFRKVWRYYQGQLAGKKIAILGGAYKPNSSSIEKATILTLLPALWAQGCITTVYDPKANDQLQQQFNQHPLLTVSDTLDHAVNGADAVLIVTAWDEFKHMDLQWLKTQLKTPVLFDGRNLFEPQHMLDLGFKYFAIGRGNTI